MEGHGLHYKLSSQINQAYQENQVNQVYHVNQANQANQVNQAYQENQVNQVNAQVPGPGHCTGTCAFFRTNAFY